MPEFILFDSSTGKVLFRREAKDVFIFMNWAEYGLRMMALKNPENISLASNFEVAQITPDISIKPAELSQRMKNIIESKRPILLEQC